MLDIVQLERYSVFPIFMVVYQTIFVACSLDVLFEWNIFKSQGCMSSFSLFLRTKSAEITLVLQPSSFNTSTLHPAFVPCNTISLLIGGQFFVRQP